MSNYTNKQAMIDSVGERELIQLTDRTGTGVIDDAVLDKAIGEAEAAIDDALASAGYIAPMAAPTEFVSRIAADIAVCRLYDHDMPPVYEMRCKEAARWLEQVASGKRNVPGADKDEQTAGAAVAAGNRQAIYNTECLDKMLGGSC